MSIETKQLHALSKIYQEAVYGGAKKKSTDMVVTNADKKANTPAYKNYKAGHKGYKAADHLKSESFSNWREDLKEVPDYNQIPVDSKKSNEKISEKNVKNTIKINPEMKEEAEIISETEIDEGVYEKQKTKEVMGALKKRDLKKDVKKKIAADIVKKKGDTSKSDDRYSYESKLWDQVAANLTELGELNDATFKVEGYQRDPEGGEEKERKAKRERKGGYDEKRSRRMNDPKKGINSPAFQEFMRSRGM